MIITLDDTDKYSLWFAHVHGFRSACPCPENCPWKKHGGPTLYHTGELVDILVGCLFFCTSGTHAFECLIRWLLPFSKPHELSKNESEVVVMRSFRCPVHEFLLAVDDSPQKFELLIGIARREATFQPMRDFDCKLSQSSTKKYPVGLPGLSSLSPTWYIFFFSPYPGGRGAQMIFLNGFLAFFKSWQCKTANQVVCLFILFRVFQSRATLSCFMMLKSYLWFETMFALAADLDIYIWLFTITICLFLS